MGNKFRTISTLGAIGITSAATTVTVFLKEQTIEHAIAVAAKPVVAVVLCTLLVCLLAKSALRYASSTVAVVSIFASVPVTVFVLTAGILFLSLPQDVIAKTSLIAFSESVQIHTRVVIGDRNAGKVMFQVPNIVEGTQFSDSQGVFTFSSVGGSATITIFFGQDQIAFPIAVPYGSKELNVTLDLSSRTAQIERRQ